MFDKFSDTLDGHINVPRMTSGRPIFTSPFPFMNAKPK